MNGIDHLREPAAIIVEVANDVAFVVDVGIRHELIAFVRKAADRIEAEDAMLLIDELISALGARECEVKTFRRVVSAAVQLEEPHFAGAVAIFDIAARHRAESLEDRRLPSLAHRRSAERA